MRDNIIKVDPLNPEPAFLEAGKVIRQGGIIAYPTDTYYGLGADPFNIQAVKRIFAIKGRHEKKPVPLVISSYEWAEKIAGGKLSPAFRKLTAKYWPGPLSIIIPAPGMCADITAGTGTIACRIPASGLTLGLLEIIGHPLTSTSANPSGLSEAASPEDIDANLRMKIDLVLDCGNTPGGAPSTIIAIDSDGKFCLIREGKIPFCDIISGNEQEGVTG